jgi:small subunit ribosomal protein S12e
MAAGDESSQGMKLKDAMKEVLKESLKHDGLARGLREAVKALDKRQAYLCIVAKNCNEAAYLRLVEALCNEHQISLLKVTHSGWVGVLKWLTVRLRTKRN